MNILRRFFGISIMIVLLFSACSQQPIIDVNETSEESDQGDSSDIEDEQMNQQEERQDASQPGYARDNPAAVGTEVIADGKSFVVLGATRPADEVVAEANSLNEEAPIGEEYLLVEFQMTCVDPVEGQCSFNPFNVIVIDSLDESHTRTFVAGIEDEHDSDDFDEGVTVSGQLAFMVGQDDTELVMVYTPFSGGAYFLEIPEN
jgi:hypothetical protein